MKRIFCVILALVLSLSVFTVTFAEDITGGLIVRSLNERIVPDETFKVLLFVSSDKYPIYSYQFKINFDNTYFELQDIYSSVNTGYEGLNVIDNKEGTATYSYFLNGAQLSENNSDRRYKVAMMEFKTLKAIDKNQVISFDSTETVFLNQAGVEVSATMNDLVIEVPEAPTKKSPVKSTFTIGEYAKFATTTKDADIYYTTSDTSEPTTKMNGSIKLPSKNVTYYVIAKKYGIESRMSTFKLSLKREAGTPGGSTGGNTGGNTGTITPTPTPTPSTPTTPAPETPVKYGDIQNHWAKDNILKLVNKGIVTGYEDGSIRPENQVTRQEIAKLIVSALNAKPTETIDLPFSDSDEIASWAQGYVQTAVNLGILNGYDDGTFKPTQPVSRKELAKIAISAFKMEQANDILTFSDASSIPEWAYGFVASAFKNGIITGYEDNTFKPDRNVTRAETCTILIKCLN